MNANTIGNGKIANLVRSLRDLTMGFFAGRRADRFVIITYHRVLPARDTLLPDEPTREEFAWQMRILAAHFNVLSIENAMQRLHDGTLPKHCVAITFDDGYRNNYEVALPILDELELPATFFVAAGYLDGGCMWNDVIIESIRGISEKEVDLSVLDLSTFPLATIESKRAAIAALLAKGKYLPFEARQAFAETVRHSANANLPTDLMLTSQQVQQLADAGHTIGAHTISHPILSNTEDSAAKREIIDGKAQLESIIEKPIETFAYPNGQPGTDYDQIHVEMLKDAGFRYAVTTHANFVNIASSPFELPRIAGHRADALRFRCNLVSSYIRE